MLRTITYLLDQWGRSRIMCLQNFQYACAASGIISVILAFVGCAASGFLPPIAPTLSAEETVRHYKEHEKGIQAGAIMIVFSGMFYLPFTAAMSSQIRRIPNLHNIVSTVQLVSGTAGTLTFVLPGLVLAVANLRLDRPIEITQTLDDFFWITILMPWPPFMVQTFAFGYAIIVDAQPSPPFPKFMAVLNIGIPILYFPSIAVHIATTGPVAWNGAVSFWVSSIAFGTEILIDSIFLIRAISAERRHEREDNRYPAHRLGSNC